MKNNLGCHKKAYDNQVEKVICRKKLVFNKVKVSMTTKNHFFPLTSKN